MKAEYLNSFYKATQDVFRLMLDTDVEKGQLKAIEGMVCSKDANVILGVTGDLKGTILFSFTSDMTLEMVRIMSGMEMHEIDNFVSSALGEVANIIGGNAVTNLTEYNYICDIAPPQIIIGEYKSISMANKLALLLPLKTHIGEFDINVFLAEN
ncbi:chemotaxis protein CheX [Tissierella carlieri]|jgi:chemotaxis protein CheX|uniref:Chemotaxis protein CheX n=1 Tax=Tissierella carlieri TaxID=689904 RepID=A0ABT1SF86_9FIRM|nr:MULTISPECIES: chemotaxis protein CheX [Tissierella]MBU5312157.1 chemotaxis protein CheX [Tissierella carlieri]MCQ4925149.1 chemotaxis protein CheX [Tissierella carlieri]MDU5080067.1 chemotaxis protein CheX [Bacillota bacterium]OZV13292.1 chemotaxis protein CheX [Tissierella sp. P1]